MENELLQLGIVGFALLFLIKELFTYLKTRNNKEEPVDKQLLATIKTLNNNHLNTMQKSLDKMCQNINTGNDRVVDAIKEMHTDLASRLGELKGKLDK